MAEKSNKIVIILLILALLFFLYYKGYFNNILNDDVGRDIGITVGYLDANKNPIGNNLYASVQKIAPGSPLAAVSGVAYLNLSVYARNTGTVPLTCVLTSATISPINNNIFRDAYFASPNNANTVSQSLPVSVNSKRLWSTYPVIAVSNFEPAIIGNYNEVRFDISVTCSQGATPLPVKTSYITLKITKEGTATADFTVEISDSSTSSSQTDLCGNNAIDTGEQCDSTASNPLNSQTCALQGKGTGTLACDVLTCQFDYTGCTTGGTKVKYRTSNIDYLNAHTLSGGYWVAYANDGCGNALTGYGYDGTGAIAASTCCSAAYGAPLIADVVKEAGTNGHLYGVGFTGNGVISLHSSGGNLYLCENSAGCTTGRYYRYTTARTQSFVLDATAQSGYSGKEMTC